MYKTKKSRVGKLVKAIIKPLTGKDQAHKPDYVLLVAVAIIVFFGLLMLSSATSVISFERFDDSYYYIKQQITRGLLPGLLIFFFLVRFKYDKLKKLNWLWLLVTLGLLVLVFIPGLGVVINNAKSWVSIAGLNFQTSELAKLTFIIYLAIWLEAKQSDIADWSRTFIPFLILVGLIAGLILLQPDLGTMMIFVIFSTAMYLVAGMSYKQLTTLLLLGAVSLYGLIKAAPYRLARFTSFLNPESDPQGASYQLYQALIAVGSGGLFGLGLGHSRQKFEYLPEVAADSIFAITAEEWGFVFSTIFVLLYLVIFLRGVKIAKNAPDTFAKLLAVGITSWIVLQAVINIGAIIGILPLTGVPLPFVSLGGTNLVVVLAAIAILTNISKYTKTSS